MKNLVIYHGNCDDGFGSAWVASLSLPPDTTEYFAARYGDKPPIELCRNICVFILDFSYPAPDMREIFENCAKLIVLDHHKTAQAALKEFTEQYKDNPDMHVTFDMGKSGIMLTWEYFNIDNPDPKPPLVQHIQDNDLWHFHLPYTKDFIRHLRSYPQTFDAWNRINHTCRDFMCSGYQDFCRTGTALTKQFEQLCENVVQSCRFPVSLFGHMGFCCNTNYIFASDVGHILTKLPDAEFGMTYFIREDGKYVFSFRSVGDFDVSEIAKKLGGGGHKNAAGVVIDEPGSLLILAGAKREAIAWLKNQYE